MNKIKVYKKKILLISGILVLSSLMSMLIFRNTFRVNAFDRTWVQNDWRGGVYSGVVTENVTTFLEESDIDFSSSSSFSMEGDSQWDLPDWGYRSLITFDNTVENIGVTPEQLLNFPVLIKLEDGVNINYSDLKEDGSDIRFVDSNGDTLSYEIDSWDNTGESTVWVKVPIIEVGDTSYIYMYYSNESAVDSQDANGVWSDGFTGVWHMNDTTESTISDSTSFGSTGTKYLPNDPNPVSGYIGWSQNFNSEADYIEIPDTKFREAFSQLSLEYWVRIPTLTNGYQTHLHRSDAATIGSSVWWAGLTNSNLICVTIGAGNGAWADGQTNITAQTNRWYHIAGTWDGSHGRVYVDGQLVKTYNKPTVSNKNSRFTLSRMHPALGSASYYTISIIDDVRMSNVARSSAWLAASYTSGNGDFSIVDEGLSRYPSSSILTSNVFDTDYPSDWGELTYTTSGSGIVEVRVRTDLNEGMNSASDWSECEAISSGSLITENSCVNDEDRYIQYQVTLKPDGAQSPEFEGISISFGASDQTAPISNAGGVYMAGNVEDNQWVNFAPVLNWDAGEDDLGGGGVQGYCISLDEVGVEEGSSALDPRISSGILMNLDDGVSNSGCPYIVEGTSVDLSEVDGLSLTSNRKYYVSLKAVDFAGNVYTGSSLTYQDLAWFRYDGTRPNNVMYISAPSTDFGSIDDMFFNWPITGQAQASDNESGLLGWQYAINSTTPDKWGGTSTSASLGVEYIPDDGETSSIYLSILKDGDDLIVGNNTIYFRSIDISGNVSTYVTGGINYGGAAPEFPAEAVVTVTPQESISNNFSLSWPEANPVDGDEITSYYYMINTQPPASLSSLLNNSHVYIPTTQTSISTGKLVGAVKGLNNVYVVAVDNNDNYSATKAIHGTFQLNSTLPDAPRNVSAADLSIKSNELWRVALTWEEPEYKGNGDLSYIIYRSELGVVWDEISSTTGLSYTDIVPTSQEYIYRVASIDSSNESRENPSYSTDVSLHPKGRFDEPPELISQPIVENITTRYARINWLTDRVSDSKIQIGLSSGEYFQDEMYRSDMVINHEIELKNLQPGTTYYYRAKWTDEDGNTGTSSESTFQTKPAPVVENIQLDSVGLNYAIFKVTTTGATKATILYGKTKAYGGSVEINTSTVTSEYSIMLNELEDGTPYHYKIMLVDEEGFDYESFEDHVFETPPRPRVSDVQIQEKWGVAVPTVEVFWESNIEVTSIVRYTGKGRTLDKVDMELIKGEHRMDITGLDPDTEYSLVVEGVDRMGNRATSDVYSFNTAVDTRPPEISNIRSEGDLQSVEIQPDSSRSAQLIISWETDEPSTSQVMYGEGAGGDSYPFSTQTDSEMRFKHVMVVNNLTPSKVYHFKVVSRDSAGNMGESGSVTAITPKGSGSVLESVLGSLGRIFRFL